MFHVKKSLTNNRVHLNEVFKYLHPVSHKRVDNSNKECELLYVLKLKNSTIKRKH